VKGYLLDTNVIAELSGDRPDAHVLKWLSSVDESLLWISIIALAEYEKGIAQLPPEDSRRAAFAAKAQKLAARFSQRLLPVSNKVMLLWGRIAGQVRREKGHPPPPIDALLAATAMAHDLVLVTRNIKDVVHTGALVLNPWDS
jgi:toxin FitB